MDKLVLYTVTKSSSDLSIRQGDMVWLSNNGDLNSVKGRGWLLEEEWNQPGTNDFEVEICRTHYVEVYLNNEYIKKK